jgi:MraZ protein
MSESQSSLNLGEHRRSLDERYRLSIPTELVQPWGKANREGVLVKERPGCLSLWRQDQWQERLDRKLRVVEAKLQAEQLGTRLNEMQMFGRLLSTRHRPVQLAGRGRLAIPEGFRDFLGAEPGGEVFVIGAVVCIEIWQLDAWLDCLKQEIPQFDQLLDDLSR